MKHRSLTLPSLTLPAPPARSVSGDAYDDRGPIVGFGYPLYSAMFAFELTAEDHASALALAEAFTRAAEDIAAGIAGRPVVTALPGKVPA